MEKFWTKERKAEENRRNGHSSKTVRSEYGEMDLTVPRYSLMNTYKNTCKFQ